MFDSVYLLVPAFQAQVAAAESSTGFNIAGLVNLLPFIAMFAVLYFLLLRPASKQRSEQQQMLQALKVGDAVITSGGIYGRIVAIESSLVHLEVADRTKIRILRDRIAGLEGTAASTAPAAQTST